MVDKIIGLWGMNSVSSPFPLILKAKDWDEKFQPSNHKVSFPGNQPPSLGEFQKSLY